MKRTFTSILLLTLTMIATLKVSAQTPPVQSPDRDKISNVMMNMIDQWDHQSFLNAVGLVTQVAEYDMSAMTSELVGRIVGMKTAIEGTPDYHLLFSNKILTGHFVVKNGKWVKESDANDLQLSYTAPNGVPCMLRMVTSGNVKTTDIPIDEDFLDEDDDEYGYGYDDDEMPEDAFALLFSSLNKVSSIFNTLNKSLKPVVEDVKLMTVEIPEKTTIEVTYGGTTLVSSTIEVNLNSIGETMYDGMVMTMNTKFFKGGLTRSGEEFFEIALNNTGYMPGMGFNVDLSIKKNNLLLFSSKISAPGTLVPIDLGDLLSGGTLYLGIESFNVDINFMNQMQLKGGIEDLNALFAAMMTADEEDPEATIATLNQMINMFVYYDGSDVPAAKIQLMPVFNEEYMEMELQPAIVFARDNNVFPLHEFLTAEYFPEVAQGAMEIVKEVFGLVDVIQEKANNEATGISIKPANNASATAYYTLDGRRTTTATRGIKIVTMSDGTIRKVVR